MSRALCAAATMAVTHAAHDADKLAGAHPVTPAAVDIINSENRGWRAMSPEKNKFSKYSVEQIRGMMGVREMEADESHVVSGLSDGDLPESFDMRTSFGDCVTPIRDQGDCGSCWAFAGAETLTTNLCAQGVSVPPLSEQELLSCVAGGTGCGGLSVPAAWTYMDKIGLRSSECLPYAESDGSGPPACPATGACGADSASNATVFKCPTASSTMSHKADIQAAITKVGEVNTQMIVFMDLMNYETGIFRSGGAYSGAHAVTLIGWGSDPVDYWIVRNSWGADWGEKGYFRIAMDDGMSGIASSGTACLPATSDISV